MLWNIYLQTCDLSSLDCHLNKTSIYCSCILSFLKFSSIVFFEYFLQTVVIRYIKRLILLEAIDNHLMVTKMRFFFPIVAFSPLAHWLAIQLYGFTLIQATNTDEDIKSYSVSYLILAYSFINWLLLTILNIRTLNAELIQYLFPILLSANFYIFIKIKTENVNNTRRNLNEYAPTSNNRFSLTPAQKEIIPYLINGYSDSEIASFRGVSKRTINAHMRNMFEKCSVSNRVELVSIYYNINTLLNDD